MSNIPSHLHYTESHEWVSSEDDGSTRIGISDHAQEALGDLQQTLFILSVTGLSLTAAGIFLRTGTQPNVKETAEPAPAD